MTKRKHLIIGCGSAAVSAAETIRKINPEDDIKLISMESCEPYSPMSLTYVLGGRIAKEHIGLRSENFFAEINATHIKKRKVVELKTSVNEVVLDDGERIAYDNLLIATGSDPSVPSIKGLEDVDYQGFHIMEDLERIQKSVQQKKEVLVYGGGLVAMTLTIGLLEIGISVKVIVRSRILRTYFDEECGGLIADIFREKGCEIFEGAPLQKMQKENGRISFTMEDGSKINGDVLVMAVGVKPRIDFLEGSGITVDEGIVVDRKMQTSINNVFAAGDVVQSPDFFTGTSGVSQILPSAVDQGRVAGSNMVGEEEEYTGWIPINNFNFFGHRAVSVGIFNSAENNLEVLRESDANKKRYKKLVIQDRRLLGAAFLNVSLATGVMQYLIREKVDVDQVKKLLLEKPRETSCMLMQKAEG